MRREEFVEWVQRTLEAALALQTPPGKEPEGWVSSEWGERVNVRFGCQVFRLDASEVP